ncbi:Hypothetical_protein [Hexamita inflata]|uniref:Hypothetical_protein n=1 Tax=Hexamita inflata TaxID=28002 RepID=A0AA86RD98_9EUKA|nr:Hypothetical protein HINF_LOCUS58702 [Hexamita inflata]
MELQEDTLINLINSRKFAPISINAVCIEDPVQTDESSDEKISPQQLFCELLHRRPQPLIFDVEPLKQNHNDLKLLKIEEICSLIKTECQVNRISPEVVKKLRSAKNNINLIKIIINELEDNENLVYIVQKLNYITNIPEYEVCSQSIASSLAADIFTGFKPEDEKILKFIIDIAPLFE